MEAVYIWRRAEANREGVSCHAKARSDRAVATARWISCLL
jgi:hypothetical protein